MSDRDDLAPIVEQWGKAGPITWAESKSGWILPDGKPIVLADWQRAILTANQEYRPSTLFISTTKKAGKTLLNSLLLCHRWLTMIESTHFIVTNDLDQSQELQFSMLKAMVKRHPILSRKGMVSISKKELVFNPTGSRIVTLPHDAPGSAGSNHVSVSYSEIWGYTHESARRLFEELTLPPLVDGQIIIDSYAGFLDESELLQTIWDRGLAGEKVSDDWPIFQNGGLLAYVHTGLDAQKRCWRGSEAEAEKYYTEQKAVLRENSYRRLHLNYWASGEDVFITPEMWDTLIDPSYHAPGPSKEIELYVCCDVGVKNDYCAVASVFRQDDMLHLGPYRIWKPGARPGQEVDLQSVEDYLTGLSIGYTLASMTGDPSQFLHMAQRLRAAGIDVGEFVQSIPILTKAGNTFFDVINQGRLKVYPGSAELRKHVLASNAKSTPRGIRLVKGVGKIDAAIAVAGAILAAEEDAAPRWVEQEFVSLALPDQEYLNSHYAMRQGLADPRR